MSNCGTGCNEKNHMLHCYKCGADYHCGLIHFCPTGVSK